MCRFLPLLARNYNADLIDRVVRSNINPNSQHNINPNSQHNTSPKNGAKDLEPPLHWSHFFKKKAPNTT